MLNEKLSISKTNIVDFIVRRNVKLKVHIVVTFPANHFVNKHYHWSSKNKLLIVKTLTESSCFRL